MLPTTNPVLIAAAVIPAIVLLVKVYQADRLEKEPVKLILLLVLQGVISTIPAAITERIGSAVAGLLLGDGSFLYRLVLYFAVVGLSEEGFKYLLLKRKSWNSRDFNCQFDGIVYAVSVSLGFALWENIGYTAMYGLQAALVRAVTAVPGHACFGVFMGIFYGIAKRCQQMGQQEKAQQMRKLAVLVPTLLHGCYDFIASSGGITGVFLLFVIVMFFAANRMVKKFARSDEYITTSHIYYGSDL